MICTSFPVWMCRTSMKFHEKRRKWGGWNATDFGEVSQSIVRKSRAGCRTTSSVRSRLVWGTRCRPSTHLSVLLDVETKRAVAEQELGLQTGEESVRGPSVGVYRLEG